MTDRPQTKYSRSRYGVIAAAIEELVEEEGEAATKETLETYLRRAVVNLRERKSSCKENEKSLDLLP